MVATDPWKHWDASGRTPPAEIAASSLPLLGAYDSRAVRTIEQHARWIAEAGVGAINLSWWGRDSYEDGTVHAVMDVMRAFDIKVTFHLEPYSGDRGVQFADDVTYILREYGERRRWDTMLLETADGRASPVFKSFVTLLSPTSTDCQGITTPVGIYVPDTVWGQQLERTLAHQTDPQSANWRKGFLHVPINSFNEWHEGTAFEPMMSYRDLSRSQRPLYHNTTNGSYRLRTLRNLLELVL